MANKYSAPAEFTYSSAPLQEFAQLAALKESEYQKAQLAAAELLGSFNTKEGLLTPGLAGRKNKDYSNQLLAIQESLLSNKDSMQAAMELTKLASAYKTDPEVLAGQTDYEMTPKALEYEVNNPGGYFGYRDQNGNPIQLSNLTSAEVMNAYSKVAGAPTFAEEDKVFLNMSPEEWTTLSQFKPIQTETGEIFYTNGSVQHSVRNFENMFPTLKNVLSDNFKNRNTAAANYYFVSGKGKDAYTIDSIERARLYNINKQKADINYQDSNLNPYIAKSAVGGQEDTGEVRIQWDKNPGGFIAAQALVNPDGVTQNREKVKTLQSKINELKTVGKTQEAEGLEKELNSTISSLALYDAAYNEWENSADGEKTINQFFKDNNTNQQDLDYIKAGQAFIQQNAPEGNIRLESMGVVGDQLIAQYLKQTNYTGDISQGIKDFKTTASKLTELDKIKANKVKEYIGSDVVNEIQEFVPANAPTDFYNQLHTAVRNSANLFDISGTEVIAGDSESFKALNWGSSEIKKRNIAQLLAGGLTEDEVKSVRFQTEQGGAYISFVLNRRFDDKETDFSSTGVQDEFALVNNTEEDPNGKLVLRLKLDKETIKNDLLNNGDLKSSTMRILQLAEGHTSILNSGEGGFKHASDLQGFSKSVIEQMFTPQITNYKTNYAEDFQDAAQIQSVLNGAKGDYQILGSPVIKGKPVKYADQTGVRLETGRTMDVTEPFTIQDYTNELGSQLIDVNQAYDRSVLIPNYINSVLLSDIKSNGKKIDGGFNVPYGQLIRDKEAVGNLIDNFVSSNPQFTLNDLNNYLGQYVDLSSVMQSPHTFGNSQDVSNFIFRNTDTGKKLQPQGSANPLGIR